MLIHFSRLAHINVGIRLSYSMSDHCYMHHVDVVGCVSVCVCVCVCDVNVCLIIRQQH